MTLDVLSKLCSVASPAGMSEVAALRHLATVVNLSSDLRRADGLRYAIHFSAQLGEHQLSPPAACVSRYFTANAWGALARGVRTEENTSPWDWGSAAAECELVCLREAVIHPGFRSVHPQQRCQILTNLANSYDHIGRFVEALEYYDRALTISPKFGMARGNRGVCLTEYAKALYDDYAHAFFLKHAFDDLSTALLFKLEKGARRGFQSYRKRISERVAPECLSAPIRDAEKLPGRSKSEKRYRAWCLEHRLFLNVLVDAGQYAFAARDPLHLPAIRHVLGVGPSFHGLFNQLKQEFVSARYFLFEALVAEAPHFSDRGVLLVNTLDYPSYSLSCEKGKAAFRAAYSLFDKIAFFINSYFNLKIEPRRLKFRTLWYCNQQPSRGVRSEFHQRANWPLRGLYWVSKDLLEDVGDTQGALEPDAQRLVRLRNQLEHQYVKLREDDLALLPVPQNELSDTLAISLGRTEFEQKALRVLKLTRAALMYVALAVHAEERQQEPKGVIRFPMALDTWEDRWKR